jgi:predicted dehydrogenase/threonine dehydrogenase-like Zn-dependent dehydrogenase
MKQVIQSRRSGKLALKEVPEPKVRKGHLLVRTGASLISAGTERMVVEFAKKSLAGKAKARPDLVKKVIEKAKRDGLKATFQTVMTRLDEPLPLGYSAAGTVVAVGAGLEGLYRVGERVAMAGAGLANHAELNLVPRNLVCAIPDGVSDEEAAFGTLGAIALHAVRNSGAGLGDVVAVLGMGLVGQLAAQFLRLAGARVVALDYDAARLELARQLGAEAVVDLGKQDAAQIVAGLTANRGCDAILIAAATSSSEPFAAAAEMARDRARVVLVGMTGTAFPYAEFMKKELNIIISRSYGPGRYDPDFEGRDVKYPEGWVRWTETENLAESVRLMSPALTQRLNVTPLISHRLDFEAAESAYEMITSGSEPHLGVILNYPQNSKQAGPVFTHAPASTGPCVLGVIGAGNFAKSVLLPGLKKLPGVTLHTLATQRGATADHGRQTFGFLNATADVDAVLDNPDINAILIATRHDTHAELTAKALAAGKSVLVEKPLALDVSGLNQVIEARNKTEAAFFQVGFNRRFAPMAIKLKNNFAALTTPRVMNFRINAGAIDADHWVQSADEGGGRVLGEVCHFIDFARFLCGTAITSVQAQAAGGAGSLGDDVSLTLTFADGSLANLLYTAQGDMAAGKERYELFSGGRCGLIDDFRRLDITGSGAAVHDKAATDKGFDGALSAFVAAVAGTAAPAIDEAELIETTTATLAVLESLRSGKAVDL